MYQYLVPIVIKFLYLLNEYTKKKTRVSSSIASPQCQKQKANSVLSARRLQQNKKLKPTGTKENWRDVLTFYLEHIKVIDHLGCHLHCPTGDGIYCNFGSSRIWFRE